MNLHLSNLARIAARLAVAPSLSPPIAQPDGGRVCELIGAALPPEAQQAARAAWQWAAAADRPLPGPNPKPSAAEAWPPELCAADLLALHPLTGQAIALAGSGMTAEALEAAWSARARALVPVPPADLAGSRRAALTLWRFLSATAPDGMGDVWPLLPADPRVPDHTLWDAQDLAAALAGAIAADAQGGAALLAVSLGPVQDFIAASRSTSDLWAGSHLLSRLSWEAMRVVCEELGPEAVIFPRLRGVPQVDLWLRDDEGVAAGLFDGLDWVSLRSDANPLFAAALPNRFTAVVPAAAAAGLAERITQRVRDWVSEQTVAAFRRLLKAADNMPDSADLPGYAQIRDQLAGFPEVHWAAVPWSLAHDGAPMADTLVASDARLAEAMQHFFAEAPPGYLASDAWKVARVGLSPTGDAAVGPHPGALYPALHELLERLMAAVKSTRGFDATSQHGWRCSLTGETEWITTDRRQLERSYRKNQDTVWARAVGHFGIRPGEHLGALSMLKRLWPSLFVAELRDALGTDLQRFVVSTHTMALAGTLAIACQRGAVLPDDLQQAVLSSGAQTSAMPRRLRRTLGQRADDAMLRRLSDWLELATDDGRGDAARRRLARTLGAPVETYYGLLMLDGDRMGSWLSPDVRDPAAPAMPYLDSLHPKLRALAGAPTSFARLAACRRAASPARHMAISEALANFSLRLAPAVVEELFNGKLLYAGGDDVLALLPAAELMPAAAALRAAYSGQVVSTSGGAGAPFLEPLADGFAKRDGRTLRLMGAGASASAGLVVAHHQTPLSAVMRELRAAEQRAKGDGGRNAWSLTLLKRAGGAVRLTAKWGAPLDAFVALRDFLADPGVSRRAVYNTLDWVKDLPAQRDLITALLSQQLERQAERTAWHHCDGPGIVRKLVDAAFDDQARPASAGAIEWLQSCLIAAEFVARATRHEVAATAAAAAAEATP